MRLAFAILLLLCAALRSPAQVCDTTFSMEGFGGPPGDSLFYMASFNSPADLDSLATDNHWELPCMDWERYRWEAMAYCRWCLRCDSGHLHCHRNVCMTTWMFRPVPR